MFYTSVKWAHSTTRGEIQNTVAGGDRRERSVVQKFFKNNLPPKEQRALAHGKIRKVKEVVTYDEDRLVTQV
jgi:hypothetical protein